MNTTPKLSKAQEKALREIRSPGGHGFGSYSYLTRATAEALSRMGLIVLGTKETSRGLQDASIPWAIAVGAERPYSFRSREETSAAWDAAAVVWKVRQEEHRAKVEARTLVVMASARERRRTGETDEGFASRLVRVEAAVRANVKNLEVAERELGLAEKVTS